MLALTFQVGADRVAVDVRWVREVIPCIRLTPTTGTPHWVAGAFVYRGRVVPVIDLHSYTGAGTCPQELSTRIVLVPMPDDPNALVGLMATHVAEIRELPDPLSELPPTGGPTLGPAVADGTRIIHLFNPHRFLLPLASALSGARP